MRLIWSCVLAAGIGVVQPGAATADDALAFEPVGQARKVSRTDGSGSPELSRHGRVITYTSQHREDGYEVRMRRRGEAGDVLVSWPHHGRRQPHALSLRPDVSADGRYVVYDSNASNLVEDDDNRARDVFLYDVETGQNTLITRLPSGQASGGDSGLLSDDGRYVLITTRGAIDEDDTNDAYDAYRYEIATGSYELVVRALDGGPGNDNSFASSISGDGRVVAFTSYATDLVEGPQADFIPQLYERDMATSEIRMISIGVDGLPADSWIGESDLSRTGGHIAFTSYADNLVEGVTGYDALVFLFDLETGKMSLASVGVDGALPDGECSGAKISGNGRFVTYASLADNLVPYGTSTLHDVFLYDTSYRTTYLLSHRYDGTSVASPYSRRPAIGASSRFVAFASTASDIVEGDDNGESDVFFYRIKRVGLVGADGS